MYTIFNNIDIPMNKMLNKSPDNFILNIIKASSPPLYLLNNCYIQYINLLLPRELHTSRYITPFSIPRLRYCPWESIFLGHPLLFSIIY